MPWTKLLYIQQIPGSAFLLGSRLMAQGRGCWAPWGPCTCQHLLLWSHLRMKLSKGFPGTREEALPCLEAHSSFRWCTEPETADARSSWQARAPWLWWVHGQGPETGWLVPSLRRRSAGEGKGVTKGAGPGQVSVMRAEEVEHPGSPASLPAASPSGNLPCGNIH